MGWYDVQLVCLRGHQITDSINRSARGSRARCDKCGAETISRCPSCNELIPGEYHADGVIFIGGPSAPVPRHCHKCGMAYPWNRRHLRVIGASVAAVVGAVGLVMLGRNWDAVARAVGTAAYVVFHSRLLLAVTAATFMVGSGVAGNVIADHLSEGRKRFEKRRLIAVLAMLAIAAGAAGYLLAPSP